MTRLSDDALLDLVQIRTLGYFWDFGHPVSGMARERSAGDYGYDVGETVTPQGGDRPDRADRRFPFQRATLSGRLRALDERQHRRHGRLFAQ